MNGKLVVVLWASGGKTGIEVDFGGVDFAVEGDDIGIELKVIWVTESGLNSAGVWNKIYLEVGWRTKFNGLEDKEMPFKLDALGNGKPVQRFSVSGDARARKTRDAMYDST